MLLSKKKKTQKKKLCSKAITSDLIDFFPLSSLVKERGKERQTDSFKKGLSPHCNTKSPLWIRLSRQRGGTKDYKPKCMHQPIAGQDPGSTATSRCSSRKHKTGTMVLVLTSHLPSASSKSTDITDQASFPSTDTVNTTKNCPYGC